MKHTSPFTLALAASIALALLTPNAHAAGFELFARTNLTTWCIVPFDAKQRGPEERAQMLEKLGFRKFAYDWRSKDVPTFDAEVAAMKRHGVEFTAWWFPGALNTEARAILDCIKRNNIRPQLWTMLEGGPHLRLDKAFESTPEAQKAHIERLVARVKPIAAEAAKLGCQVALYNHGGWIGIPENQIEIVRRLRQDGVENVGMVYTQHHGYGEIDRFAELFPKMQPYLLAVSLHGLTRDGDLKGLGAAPLGQGEEDLRLLRIIKKSGWTGPVSLIGEMSSADVELRLQDQLDGLDWLVPQLEGKPPGPLPVPRVWKKPAAPRAAAATAGSEASVSAAFGKALRGGTTVAGKAEYRRRPLTVECWAKLDSATAFNILVASDTKASAEHWELYSFVGSGNLSLYQPGRGGNFSADVNICDSKWHYLAAIIEPERVRLFVDGRLVKDAPARPLTGEALPGDLAFGQLVEGSIGCDGVVDNVRLSRRAREISGLPAGPLAKDAITIDLWNFDEGAAASGNSVSAAFGRALSAGMTVAGKAEFRQRPLTVECWARLDSSAAFNILVASDAKTSAEHWELYTHAGSGALSLYQPGRGGDFNSGMSICDSKWHHLAAVIEPERVRLFVDGKLAKDAPATPLQGEPRPGGLAFGQLVEGGIGCDGAVDNVRLSRGAREISGVPPGPLTKDAATIGLWNFEEAGAGNSGKYWAVEEAAARAALPEFKTIPAASPHELTPHNGWPAGESHRSWTRSHGGDANERFSALTQINRGNVKQLEVAWTFHSGDGKGNIQCNPAIVNGVMFAPTVGDHFVAVDAATGRELWRFKPDGRPAFRGITWWPGTGGSGERLFFPTEGNWLYALDPKTGRPVESFGKMGRVKLPHGARVAPGIFERTLVLAGYLRDVEAFDAVTGAHRWTFHTVPHEGEFGADTWDHMQENAANCWGGMAMDSGRGIAYIATGSPKPNFLGMLHRGDNLFANCVVALDARTGRRLWHFQEIRHDIWDLDVPAPPILTTITRDGKKVDVVAAVTKIGNTLLLDRVTGKPVFPFRMRRAPTSTLPGEITAAYQPDLDLPQPFARQEFKLTDASERTEEVRERVLDQLKSAQFGWFLPLSDRKVTVFYNVHGGAEWTGACADPTRGRLYVTANEVPWLMSLLVNDEPRFDPNAKPTHGEEIFRVTCVQCHGLDRMGIGVAPPLRGLRHRLKDADVVALLKTGRGLMPVAPPMSDADQQALLDFLFLRDRPAPKGPPVKPERPQFVQTGWNRFLDAEGYPACKPPWGTLNCIDLNSGRLLWKVPLGEHDELKKQGVPKTGTENFGGALVTAGGLVFAGGTRDEKLRAFDAETGEELWSVKLPWGASAPPAVYEVNGRQHVVIAATGGGKLGLPMGDAYVAFALPKL